MYRTVDCRNEWKTADASRPTIEAKIRQANRISELGAALAAAGYITLDEQARALGLSRRTSRAFLKGSRKDSGLSAATISRMLCSPELPRHARATVWAYVEEKVAGLYGHNKEQLRRFAARFDPSAMIGQATVRERNGDD